MGGSGCGGGGGGGRGLGRVIDFLLGYCELCK